MKSFVEPTSKMAEPWCLSHNFAILSEEAEETRHSEVFSIPHQTGGYLCPFSHMTKESVEKNIKIILKMVLEWFLLSEKRWEQFRHLWWYLTKSFSKEKGEFKKYKQILDFFPRNISQCKWFESGIIICVHVKLLTVCIWLIYLFIFSLVQWGMCMAWRQTEMPITGRWLQALWQRITSVIWMWPLFFSWHQRTGSDVETDWKLKGKLGLFQSLVTFWCVILQNHSSVPTV